MRSIRIYRNDEFAGVLTEENRKSYVFQYNEDYFFDINKPAISLTLPKTQREYRSSYLFPFFFNMLSEGVNKTLQTLRLKVDPEDSFGLLMATAQFDTIRPITTRPLSDEE